MKQTLMNWQKNQSATIDLLRFPLALAVIFIHINPETINLQDADFPMISWQGLYNILGIAISNVIALIAVPTFFLISGFLFFLNFPNWTWEGYKKKMKSRITTLLIPYIVWNIVAIGIIICWRVREVFTKGDPWKGVYDYIQEHSWHIFYDCNKLVTTRTNMLGWPLSSTGPFDFRYGF